MATAIDIVKDAEAYTLLLALNDAYSLSSGRYSTAVLSKPVNAGGWGSPYGTLPGKIRKAPPYVNQYYNGDPAKINMQTGDFFSKWKYNEPKLLGNSVISSIENTSDHADNLANGISSDGIPMRKRPLPELIAYKMSKKRVQNILKSIVDSANFGIQTRF
jgi:hypothetical protein